MKLEWFVGAEGEREQGSCHDYTLFGIIMLSHEDLYVHNIVTSCFQLNQKNGFVNAL